MEAMSGGFVRLLPEKEKEIGQKINVIHDIMQARAFEAALQFEIDDEEVDMIRMVPTPKPDSNFNSDLDPNHSLEQVVHNIDTTFTDFDLSFLPNSGDCDLDEVCLSSPESSLLSLSPPSPSDQACLSPSLVTDLDCGLTMFSPSSGGSFDPKKSANSYLAQMESPPRYVPSASPLSLAPSSPYSPGLRPMIRLSSTDSVKTNSSINLKEDLSELAELQRQTQQPPSVLRRALEDGSLRLYPGTMNINHEVKNETFEETKLASVLSMVMDHLDMDPLEHMRKEIQSQCSLLNISADPQCWSQSDVVAWMRHKMQELKIPSASCQPALQWASNFEGSGFVQISEDEFKARLPEGGDRLYNTLEMWKNSVSCYNTEEVVSYQQPPSSDREEFDVDYVLQMCDNYPSQQPPPPPEYMEVTRSRNQQQPPSYSMASIVASSLEKPMPPIEDLLQSDSTSQQQQQQVVPPPPYPGSSITTLQPPSSHHSSTHELTEDEADDNQDENDPMSPCSSKSGPIRGSSSNIHLWQFVKDLLNQPQHSGAIHWVDRDQGIFKIVDSVRVAELWGKRKNRPAMNFDKLSRSLRQYYKKGIMKKTSRPQRLVYQFCTPYHL